MTSREPCRWQELPMQMVISKEKHPHKKFQTSDVKFQVLIISYRILLKYAISKISHLPSEFRKKGSA